MNKKKEEAPDVNASIRYIVRLNEKLMVSNNKFADLVIDQNQTFRVHKKPFVCISNGTAESPIVVAEIINPSISGVPQYSAADLENIHAELIFEKIQLESIGRDKHGVELFKKVDKRWAKLSESEMQEIESTYFKKPVMTAKEPVLEEV